MKFLVTTIAICAPILLVSGASGQDASQSHEKHHQHGAAGDHTGQDHTGEDHTGHDHAPPKTSSNYQVTRASYAIPTVELTTQYGGNVRLDRLLAEDRPTLVQFIFTSCTTICPVMGAVFGGAQSDIAALAPNFRMVSISIDPEFDTPERLREFAVRQSANPDWLMLTGSKEEIFEATKAFDALYQGDNKMYHQPYTFIRWRKEEKWVRIRGLMSVADLVKEFRSAAPATN